MTLSWKDLVTTILAAFVFGLYFAMTKGIELPIITSYRWAIAALGILGIALCVFSEGTGTNGMTPYVAIASFLGIAAFILIVYGLITGAEIAFILLTFTLLILWVIATLRHLITKS